MANMFDENGNYNKTEWKPGDRITAGKLNKIEESLEAINNNDIERHKEADERLDALEEQNEAVEERFDELEDLVADNKSEVDTAIYEVHSKMDRLEQEMNDGIDTVEAIAHTVDDKIADADANMKAQVNQGKADINAIIDEVEKISDLEAINEQLARNEEEKIFVKATGLYNNDISKASENRIIFNSLMGAKGKRIIIPPGTYYIDQPIYFTKECHIEGAGWTYGGTTIVPTGDFSAFIPDPSQLGVIHFTRNTFKNFKIDGQNVKTAIGGFEFEDCYLTNIEDVFFHSCGCSFIESDSIMFHMCKFMDYRTSSSCIAVDIKSSARSIHFNQCNFEIGPGSTVKLLVDSSSQNSMDIVNCQFERAFVHIIRGRNVNIRNSKGEVVDILLDKGTSFCTVEDINGPSMVQDFGFRNKIINLKGNGMNYGGKHVLKVDESSSLVPNDNNIWKSSKELMFFSSVVPTKNNSVQNCKIQYLDASDNNILIKETPVINTLYGNSSTVGSNKVDYATFHNLIKPNENGVIIKAISDSNNADVITFSYENLLENGLFSNHTNFEGWEKRYQDSYTNVTHIDGEYTLISSDGVNKPALYQTIKLKANHAYMIIASIRKGYISFGETWNGTPGARPSVAMMKACVDPENEDFNLTSCYYYATKNENRIISLGSIDTTGCEVRWVALIDISDWGLKLLNNE